MDKITIKSLKFHGLHGYYDREREQGNEFEVDVTAKGPFRQAIHDNNLDLTFNYEWVENIVADILNGKKEKLIETLCFNIGEKLFKKAPHIQKLIVTVRKLNPPIKTPVAYAEITMKWKR